MATGGWSRDLNRIERVRMSSRLRARLLKFGGHRDMMVGEGGAWPEAVAHPVSGSPAKKREKDSIDGENK